MNLVDATFLFESCFIWLVSVNREVAQEGEKIATVVAGSAQLALAAGGGGDQQRQRNPLL